MNVNGDKNSVFEAMALEGATEPNPRKKRICTNVTLQPHTATTSTGLRVSGTTDGTKNGNTRSVPTAAAEPCQPCSQQKHVRLHHFNSFTWHTHLASMNDQIKTCNSLKQAALFLHWVYILCLQAMTSKLHEGEQSVLLIFVTCLCRRVSSKKNMISACTRWRGSVAGFRFASLLVSSASCSCFLSRERSWKMKANIFLEKTQIGIQPPFHNGGIHVFPSWPSLLEIVSYASFGRISKGGLWPPCHEKTLGGSSRCHDWRRNQVHEALKLHFGVMSPSAAQLQP